MVEGALEQRSAPAPPRRICPGEIDPPATDATSDLAAALQDPVAFVRVWAAAALARVAPAGGESVTVLTAKWGNELAFVRSLAAWHLGRLGPAFPGIEQAFVPSDS